MSTLGVWPLQGDVLSDSQGPVSVLGVWPLQSDFLRGFRREGSCPPEALGRACGAGFPVDLCGQQGWKEVMSRWPPVPLARDTRIIGEKEPGGMYFAFKSKTTILLSVPVLLLSHGVHAASVCVTCYRPRGEALGGADWSPPM